MPAILPCTSYSAVSTADLAAAMVPVISSSQNAMIALRANGFLPSRAGVK